MGDFDGLIRPTLYRQRGHNEADRVTTQADARLYRCPGCGGWRYRYRLGRWHRAQPPCPCGQP